MPDAPRPRSWTGGSPTGRAAWAFLVGGASSLFFLACGVFALNDVVPPDAADSGHEANATEAGTREAAAPSCDASDLCACLPPPTLISPGAGGVVATGLDTSYVYWLASSQGGNPALYRAPLTGTDGGLPVKVLPNFSLSYPGDFTIEPPFAYFGIGNTSPYLARAPLDGGPIEKLSPVLPLPPVDLRVTASGFYWTTSESAVCFAGPDGTIAPGDSGCGGAPLARAVVPGASNGNHLAVGGSEVYWSVYRTGEILAVPTGGGAPSVLLNGANYQARPLAASASELLFSFDTSDGGTIERLAPDGSGASVVAQANAVDVFVIDQGNVYFVDGDTAARRIYKVPATGGAPLLLACDSESPQSLSVDATHLYWGNGGDGAIKRVPK